MCHCSQCRRRTGSAFGVGAYFAREKISSIGGQATTFRRQADSGRFLTFYFCPTCGTTVYWEAEAFPSGIGVAAGGFADRSFPTPQGSVWTEGACDWVRIPEGLETFQKGRQPIPPRT